MMEPKERLVLPLDVPDFETAEGWVARLRSHVGVFKVGLELFIAEGPRAVDMVHAHDAACFLDLKLHDIPATMARAARAATRHGVRYLTVHAAAGPAALQGVAEACDGTSTRILAVTVLTSVDPQTLKAIGLAGPAEDAVSRMAALAADAGINGLVCSPLECARLRKEHPSMELVVPGIRPAGADDGDQKRTATPQSALADGADVLVVGRPIRDAPDPVAAADAILKALARNAMTP